MRTGLGPFGPWRGADGTLWRFTGHQERRQYAGERYYQAQNHRAIEGVHECLPDHPVYVPGHSGGEVGEFVLGGGGP